MYKYVVFDVDGTLMNNEKAVNFAYQSIIFEKYGRYFTHEELLKGYGVPTPKALEKYGFTDIEAAQASYYKYLIEGFRKCTTFSGITELLDELVARKLPLGIVTSRCGYEVDFDDGLRPLLKYFDQIVCSDDTTLHKPNAEPLLKMLEKLGASPEESIYIGDTQFDCMCAKNAGVRFGLAKWGSNNADAIAADYILNSPNELLELLY